MNAINDLASRLNLHRAGREWRGSCPACGYGSDAFTLSIGRNGKPLLWCASCQNRDAIAAALDAAGAGALPARHDDGITARKAAEAREKATQQAGIIWSGATPVTADDPAAKYLTSRSIAVGIGNPALRYRRDVPHPGGGRHAALLARVDGPDGEMVAVHRIYVTPDGCKPKLDPPKACKGPIWGGAIRFGTDAEIVIAEGPETAIAAGILLDLPAWSAISAGNLAKGLVLPPDVRSVVIAADHDKPGIAAAEAAAHRWQREGRRTRIMKPDRAGADFADVLMQRAGELA